MLQYGGSFNNTNKEKNADEIETASLKFNMSFNNTNAKFPTDTTENDTKLFLLSLQTRGRPVARSGAAEERRGASAETLVAQSDGHKGRNENSS